MNQNTRPNRRTRRLRERGYVMPQGVPTSPTSWTPIDRARYLRHKIIHQLKQEAKAADSHVVSK